MNSKQDTVNQITANLNRLDHTTQECLRDRERLAKQLVDVALEIKRHVENGRAVDSLDLGKVDLVRLKLSQNELEVAHLERQRVMLLGFVNRLSLDD